MPMAKQAKSKQRTDEGTPSSSSTATGDNSKPPKTVTELANDLLAVINGIYTEEASTKRSVQVQTAVLLNMRELAQKMVSVTASQPSNADLLTAIQAIRGKVDVKTNEIMQSVSKVGSSWAEVAARAPPAASKGPT